MKRLLTLLAVLSCFLLNAQTVTVKSFETTTKDSTRKVIPISVNGKILNDTSYNFTVRTVHVDSVFIRTVTTGDTTKPTSTTDTIWRGVYVSGLSSIAGNKTLEDALILDLNRFKFNHISFYSIDGANSTALDKLLVRILAETKVTQLGATASSGTTFSGSRAAWNFAHPLAKYNVWNLEFEPWNATDVTAAWGQNKTYLQQMKTAAPSAGVVVILDYFGWWNTAPMTTETPAYLANNVTCYLLHDYRTQPDFAYMKTRFDNLEATGVDKDCYIIFSAEPAFMQTWLKTHTLDEAYKLVYNVYKSYGYKHVRLKGYMVFTLDFLRVAQPTPSTAARMSILRDTGVPEFAAPGFKNITAPSHLKMAEMPVDSVPADTILGK